jgi:hypothetical protein
MSFSKVSIVFALILISVIVFNFGESDEERIQRELEEKYKCFSIDDCLGKYEFQGARAFYGNGRNGYDYTPYLEKIVTAEAQYWCQNGNYKKAISVVEESNIGSSEKEDLKFKLILTAVDNYIEEANWLMARKFAIKSIEQQNFLLERINIAEKVLGDK